MRLIRFVAVACMVAVSVASLGCGETPEAPVKEADTSAETSSVETPADTEMATAKTAETATEEKATTPVSLAITGMN